MRNLPIKLICAYIESDLSLLTDLSLLSKESYKKNLPLSQKCFSHYSWANTINNLIFFDHDQTSQISDVNICNLFLCDTFVISSWD